MLFSDHIKLAQGLGYLPDALGSFGDKERISRSKSIGGTVGIGHGHGSGDHGHHLMYWIGLYIFLARGTFPYTAQDGVVIRLKEGMVGLALVGSRKRGGFDHVGWPHTRRRVTIR